jgi:glycosyltransferase involved in cell wall biosynthesis
MFTRPTRREACRLTDRLTIAVSTIGPRAATLTADRLPRLPGVAWAVLVQKPAGLPAFGGRPDITVTALPGTGAARSRNAAIERATTPWLLFADDDLTYDPAALAALLARLPGAEHILTARLTRPDGTLRKRYPADRARLTRTTVARYGTPEIALRPRALIAAGVRFDETFGAGTPRFMGEEFIFLADALRAGLSGHHAAIALASHPVESAGTLWTEQAWTIRRAVFARALGPLAVPARAAFALKNRRRFPSRAALLAFIRP